MSAQQPRMRMGCAFALLIAWCLCPWPCAAAQARAWPRLPAPHHLEAFEVGERIKLGGVPVRIQGYVSDRSPSELNRWYRQALGGRWVENTIGAKTVIGQLQGAFFITVELEPMLGGLSGSTTKVVTAVMDLSPQTMRPAQARDRLGNWAARLPMSSRLLSHMTDDTATHESLHLVAANDQSLAFNAEHFRREFRQLGFRDEPTDALAPSRQSAKSSPITAPARLAFSGSGTDAVLILDRDHQGRSTLVLILNRRKS
jgi:hypothetical protein